MTYRVARRMSAVLHSCTALSLALCLASPALAQTDPEPTEEEATGEDIVVTGQFLDTGASSATKMDIAVLDTPFSVASYNNNFLKAIETTNVSDLYRYMTGIQRAGNTGYDITLRGFKTSGNDRNAILTDGLPGLSVRFGSPPTIGVDHVELVKGPTSVLYGQGQPGGFINIITKKPSSKASFEVGLKGTAGLGTYDRARGGLISMDLTGPVTSDDVVSARFVAEGGYTQSFRDFSYEKPIYVSPGVTFDFGRTRVTLQAEYRWVKTHLDTYLVAPNRDVSRIAEIDVNYQEKDDFLIERGAIGNIFIAHEFNDWLKFNGGYRYVDHIDTQKNYDVVGFDTVDPLNVITRRARGQENIRTYSFFDANLTAKFDTFGLKHTLLVGSSGGKETASLNRLQFFNCARSTVVANNCTSLNMNIYNPVHGVAPSLQSFPTFAPGRASDLSWRYTTQNSLGFYASDLVEITEWLKVMGGVRYADEKQTIEDKRLVFTKVNKADTKWLPLGGILIQPTRNLTLYGSYSSSFVPVPAAQQDVFGLNPFEPTEANSKEVGVKAELFNRRLNVTAAYFDIKKTNTINTFTCPTTVAALNTYITQNGITIPTNAPRAANGDLIPASGTCSNQLGGERSKGFEIEVSASPLPNWQITTGYAHIDARVTASNILVQNGARLTNAPSDAFNIWSRYDFQGGLEGVGVGLGVSHISKRAGLLPTTANDTRPEGGTLPLPAYTTVDAGLYFKASDTIDLTLKVTNLFDKRYIESAGFSGDIQLVPGTPRLLTLTARSRF